MQTKRLLLLALLVPSPGLAEDVFVGVDAAEKMIAGGAAVLDARGDDAEPPYLPSAQVIDWSTMRDGAGRTGRLASTEAVKKKLETLGVSSDRPVLVYGAMAEGWGQEGRIWWTLRYLGHEHVRILDGGNRAWEAAKKKIAFGPAAAPKPGKLTVKVRGDLRASWRDVEEAGRTASAQILDVRSRKEFDGATPYYSARGGHIPKAKHFNWKTVLRGGKLLPKAKLSAQFERAGIDLKKPVITYCTGGVRAAFLQAALMHVGGRALNYDGSWWDWSARKELPVAK